MSETKITKAEDRRGLKKSEAKARMKNVLMFLPNMVKLLGRLLTDKRVPTAEKALFAGAIVYVIMPFDLIPDMIPFVGQIDDSYLVALTLLRLINRTDETVVREHWSGGGDIIALVNSIVNIAPKFLPKRVARVISSKIELTSAAKALNNLGGKKEPLIVEVNQTKS